MPFEVLGCVKPEGGVTTRQTRFRSPLTYIKGLLRPGAILIVGCKQ